MINVCCGVSEKDNVLPARIFEPLKTGDLKKKFLTHLKKTNVLQSKKKDHDGKPTKKLA